MTELFKFIKRNLFDGTNYVCNLTNEFIIDGMPVYIKLVHCRINKCIRLVLYNINIIRYDVDETADDDYNLLHELYLLKTLPDINDTVDAIITELKNIMMVLRFDAYLGKFVRVDSPNPSELDTEISELFKDCSNVTINRLRQSDKCSICLEHTMTKSICAHHICFRCVIQMNATKIVIDDDLEEEYEILCPVCRQELLF